MKRNLATYLVICLSLVFFTSCLGDEDEALRSPFAMIKTFSIGNIKSSYPSFTSEGKDTTIVKTVDFASVGFTIDQVNGLVYNNDSLPYCTDLSKVVTTMTVDGAAGIYVDSTETYDYYASTDSTDFTTPRKFRIYSEGGTYHKDYLISVNAHQVDPDLMVWEKSAAVAGLVPYCAVELQGKMNLFGKVGAKAVVASSVIGEPVSWACSDMTGLPDNANLSNVHAYNKALYVVADSAVFTSVDAVNWSLSATIPGVVAIIGSSSNELLVATETEWLCSRDGATFETKGTLPENFPLYGLSIASYPMAHNSDIVRYMLFGYSTSAKAGEPCVWSRLSTEGQWVNYNNAENQYPCPALKGLSIVRYDNFFYALGGSGTAEGVRVKAFESFYVSRDNGIIWKSLENYYQQIPSELMGNNNAFVVAVDSRNYMWIVNSGNGAATYRGIINRLGFKK